MAFPRSRLIPPGVELALPARCTGLAPAWSDASDGSDGSDGSETGTFRALKAPPPGGAA